MIQTEIINKLKSEFDLSENYERFLFYWVAKKLGFKVVDISQAVGKHYSNVFYFLKKYKIKDEDEMRVCQLVGKFNVQNYLK